MNRRTTTAAAIVVAVAIISLDDSLLEATFGIV